MIKKDSFSAFLASCLVILFTLSFCSQEKQDNKEVIKIKPYRVLLIIGDQWTDPMSYNIDPHRVRGNDFLDVVTMLKIWGVPFDILRLDEQRLQINRFLDGEAKANYGCAIWMADPAKLEGYSANYATLKQAVEEYGISLIGLFDYISTPGVAELFGVTLTESAVARGQRKTEGKSEDIVAAGRLQSADEEQGSGLKVEIMGDHFITRDIGNITLPDVKQTGSVSIPAADGITEESSEAAGNPIDLVECTAEGTIVGKVGETPQFVVRDLDNDTKTVWIGGGKDWFRKYPVMRKIFRKALVYSVGYGVFNDNFENGLIFIMDDVGCSEHAWSLMWHYPTPHKDTLIKYLIEPLEKYGFMMVQNITPGFANPEKKLIESPWTVPPFKDIFGNWQDYGSTKEGLEEGLRREVFELQPHRAWSHMNWDLDSPPGPWWGSPIDGEMKITDWYNEVVDVRRGFQPVPSNDLLFIYRMGIDAIKKSFGVTALAAEVRPGAEIRDGYPGGHENGRIAAIAGLGVSRECYVGIDHTIEFRMMMPQQFTCHDLDLTAYTGHPADQTDAGWDTLNKMTTDELLSAKIAGGRRINLRDNLNWIESRKDKKWMGFNETCAYLHAGINSTASDFMLEFNYDPHYCKYFEKKASSWTLELSDELLQRSDKASVNIDGKRQDGLLSGLQVLKIPAGLGIHKISIK